MPLIDRINLGASRAAASHATLLQGILQPRLLESSGCARAHARLRVYAHKHAAWTVCE